MSILMLPFTHAKSCNLLLGFANGPKRVNSRSSSFGVQRFKPDTYWAFWALIDDFIFLDGKLILSRTLVLFTNGFFFGFLICRVVLSLIFHPFPYLGFLDEFLHFNILTILEWISSLSAQRKNTVYIIIF